MEPYFGYTWLELAKLNKIWVKFGQTLQNLAKFD